MTVILVDPRRPALVPIEALGLLNSDVQYTEEMPVRVAWSLPSARSALSGGPDAPTLLSSNPDHLAVRKRLDAGEQLIAAPVTQRGERLVDAVAVMDKLRTFGPWESEQTHHSLQRYLLEETYELFDAVRAGNAEELCSELGDVLLQVLFHARIAEESANHAFTIDDVADTLVRKLGNRVPAVLAGESISMEDQIAQWEERKALEKAPQKALGGRFSCVDDLPTAQPALSLAQKVIERVLSAGLPWDLIPTAITTVALAPGSDAESDLRASVLEFMDAVRRAEGLIGASRIGDTSEELDASPIGAIREDEWRAYWLNSA